MPLDTSPKLRGLTPSPMDNVGIALLTAFGTKFSIIRTPMPLIS